MAEVGKQLHDLRRKHRQEQTAPNDNTHYTGEMQRDAQHNGIAQAIGGLDNVPTTFEAAAEGTAGGAETATTAADAASPSVSDLLHAFDPTEIIQREMSNLGLDERAKVYEDVHGVSYPDEETPSFLTAKLDDMNVRIHMIDDKPAYNLAEQLDRSYVEDEKLRLMFLRCDGYDPTIAAKRIIDWFELKLELFGEELLVETITLEDLSADAAEVMTDGCSQVLPTRDSSGRTVLCCCKFDLDMLPVSDASRTSFFYLSTVLLRDEETQRSGLVSIRNGNEDFGKINMEHCRALYRSGRMTETVPLRLRAFHFIAEDGKASQQVSNLLQLSVVSKVRHRCRMHSGTVKECKNILRGYGIPVDLLPIQDDGGIATDNHQRWLEQVRRQEAIILAERQERRRRKRTQGGTVVRNVTNSCPLTSESTIPQSEAAHHLNTNEFDTSSILTPGRASFLDQRYVSSSSAQDGDDDGLDRAPTPTFRRDDATNTVPTVVSPSPRMSTAITMQPSTNNSATAEEKPSSSNAAANSFTSTTMPDDLHDIDVDHLGLAQPELLGYELSDTFDDDVPNSVNTNTDTDTNANMTSNMNMSMNIHASPDVAGAVGADAINTEPVAATDLAVNTNQQLDPANTTHHIVTNRSPSLVSLEANGIMRTNNHSSYGGGDSSPLAANISDEFDDGSNSESDGGVAAHPMPAGEPTDLDVLLGRGRPFQNHSGNQYLRELIAEWFDTYDISPRRAKMAVAERVVHLINERSGRFLRRDRGAKGWVEVEFTEARDKVSHGFRKRREMLANEQKRAGKSTMPIQRSSKPAETAESKRMKVSM